MRKLDWTSFHIRSIHLFYKKYGSQYIRNEKKKHFSLQEAHFTFTDFLLLYLCLVILQVAVHIVYTILNYENTKSKKVLCRLSLIPTENNWSLYKWRKRERRKGRVESTTEWTSSESSYLSTHPFICPSIYPFSHLPICPLIYLCIHS